MQNTPAQPFHASKRLTVPLLVLAATSISFLVACGGGSDPAPMSGTLSDISVSGLSYTTSSGLSGTMTASSGFEYNQGDAITFSVGKMQLTKVTAANQIALLNETAADGSAFTDKTLYPVSVMQLLQSADADSSQDMKIELGQPFVTWANSQTAAVDESAQATVWAEKAQHALPADWQSSWQQVQLATAGSHASGKLPIAASGNHHTYVMDAQGTVVSFGEDYYKWTSSDKQEYIGGKLGRTTDALYDSLAGQNSIDSKIRERQYRYNPIPAKVDGLDGLTVKSLVSGQNDGAIITSAGDLYMWGPNSHGQLGTGDTNERRKATLIAVDGKKVRQVAIGGAHTHAITTDGDLYSWGYYKSPLGLGTAVKDAKANITTPTKVDLGTEKAIKVSTDANRNTLILTASGKVFAIGGNRYGQLANGNADSGEFADTPLEVTAKIGDTPVIDVFAAPNLGFFVTRDGKVYASGQTSQGHTGRLIQGASADTNGTAATDNIDKTNLTTPTHLPVFANVQQLVAGSRHVLVLTKDQKVMALGKNPLISAVLGIGYPAGEWKQRSSGKWYWNKKYYAVPQEITTLSDKSIANINSLTINSFAVSTQGDIFGWGAVTNGRLAVGEHNCDAVLVPKSSSVASEPFDTKRNYVCHTPRKLDLATTQSVLHTGTTAETENLPSLPALP